MGYLKFFKQIVVLRHIAAWAGFFAGLMFISLVTSSSNYAQLLDKFTGIFLHVLCFVGPVYTVFAVIDLNTRIPLRLILIVLATTLWAILLVPAYSVIGHESSFAQQCINLVSVLLGAVLFREMFRGRRAQQLLIKTETRMIGAQLAPHTLYNLLNTLYASSLVDPHRTPELILRLAEMMRYLLNQTHDDFGHAKDEWQFIESYREFVLDRSDSGTDISLRMEGNADARIPRLLLTSLFENAVKHGRCDDGKLSIIASLSIHESGFDFELKNSRSPTTSTQAGMRIGNELVQRRLKALYPGRHRFEITAEPYTFFTRVSVW